MARHSTPTSDVDVRMLRRALALAALGTGTTAPNPLVGAVIVRDGRVLAQGFHQRPGEPHAEAVALGIAARSGRDCRGATLYTNLEPCCHTGRTPPCVDAIARAGIGRVVAPIRDPNPKVDGKGFRALRAQGIRVDVGLLRAEAIQLNAGFIKLNRTGMPLVTLKGAESLDGRIATASGDSKWITSRLARRHARLLRWENDAILVGIGTVVADDPRLDRRPRPPGGGSAFLRVVLDPELRISPSARLLRMSGPLLVFCGPETNRLRSRRRRLQNSGPRALLEVESLPELRGRLDLKAALERLGARGVTRLLVEGGGETHAGFLERGLADRLVVYVAPKILGGRDARPLIGGKGVARVANAPEIRRPRVSSLGSGWVIEGEIAAASGAGRRKS